jgi:hypothetical protein
MHIFTSFGPQWNFSFNDIAEYLSQSGDHLIQQLKNAVAVRASAK